MKLGDIMQCLYGRCYHPECEADSIRGAIHMRERYPMVGEGPDFVVKMECFNKKEADEIKACLTEEEQKRVFFTWLFG
jgi:hypothetical protein